MYVFFKVGFITVSVAVKGGTIWAPEMCLMVRKCLFLSFFLRLLLMVTKQTSQVSLSQAPTACLALVKRVKCVIRFKKKWCVKVLFNLN